MELLFFAISLIVTCLPSSLGHQQVLLPSGQTILSRLPTGQTIQAQPSIIQLVRQPSGALTQVVGHPGLQQVLNPHVTTLNGLTQQQILGTDLLSYLTSLNGLNALNLNGLTTASTLGLGGLNGLGIAGLPYGNTGLTTANVNGVPVIISGLSNGLLQQTTLGAPSSIPLIQSVNGVNQPVVNLGPVVRQVAESEDSSSGLVQLDPMDAALLDMEKKGQMHMEKYAWGRNLQRQAEREEKRNQEEEAVKELRADIPRYYSAIPTGLVTTNTGEIINQNGYVLPTVRTPTRGVNPFLGIGGKRKKHFEHYEYF